MSTIPHKIKGLNFKTTSLTTVPIQTTRGKKNQGFRSINGIAIEKIIRTTPITIHIRGIKYSKCVRRLSVFSAFL